MAANNDVMYAQSVDRLQLKSFSRYVAYALTEVVKGLKFVENGREIIVHQPFGLVRDKVVTTNTVSMVFPVDYLSLCTSEDPELFVQQNRYSDNYILRTLATTLESLIMTRVARHYCLYKVATKINDAPGTISYIIGYDFGGYEDMAELKQDWFLFKQTKRVMDM